MDAIHPLPKEPFPSPSMITERNKYVSDSLNTAKTLIDPIKCRQAYVELFKHSGSFSSWRPLPACTSVAPSLNITNAERMSFYNNSNFAYRAENSGSLVEVTMTSNVFGT